MAEGNLDQAVTGPMIAALAIVTLCNPTLWNGLTFTMRVEANTCESIAQK
jgi:hypothetical protein